MKNYLITCTGDRHVSMALLAEMVAAFDMPFTWVIADDGVEPIQKPRVPINCTARHFHWPHMRRKSGSSMPTLLSAALRTVDPAKEDKIFIIEDDDCYHPGYMRALAGHLDKYDLVGIGMARYYNVRQQRYNRNQNSIHASLASTAFRGCVVPKVLEACHAKDDPFVDLRLWRGCERMDAWAGSKILVNDDDDVLFAGMKAMPGRTGAASGHTFRTDYTEDRNCEILKEWTKDYWRWYAELKA